MTVGGALRVATRRLRAGGVPDAAWDAELLLRHVLDMDRAPLLAANDVALTADQERRFLSLVTEREARRPLQHLTGVQAFWGRDFLVNADVLIPRPETEILVEAALEMLRSLPRPVVVDVGTGTGCIALTIAAENPAAEVTAIDISYAALEVARTNARRLGLEGRVTFLQGDLLAPVDELAGSVHLVASNPPYVDPSDIPGLAPEVRDHEPRLALLPRPDARDLYLRLARGAHHLLRPGGVLMLEIGRGMAEEVSGICASEGLTVERVIPDLRGIPRIVVATRPAGPNPPDLA